ncbi:hypothetical protein [Nostoc foliaceum]|nr:hypothetical protein [Nostoc foliaceum]
MALCDHCCPHIQIPKHLDQPLEQLTGDKLQHMLEKAELVMA